MWCTRYKLLLLLLVNRAKICGGDSVEVHTVAIDLFSEFAAVYSR